MSVEEYIKLRPEINIVEKSIERKMDFRRGKKFQIVFSDTTRQDFYDGLLESSYRYRLKQDSLKAKDFRNTYNYSIDGITEKII
jgi:hypothetical protein